MNMLVVYTQKAYDCIHVCMHAFEVACACVCACECESGMEGRAEIEAGRQAGRQAGITTINSHSLLALALALWRILYILLIQCMILILSIIQS